MNQFTALDGALFVALSRALIATLVAVSATSAQERAVTRSDVIAAALARGPRLAIARADSSAASATRVLARQYENPALTLEHTRSTPRQHVSVDVPLWYPSQRSLQVRSADARVDAAALRVRFERAAVTLDADTTYTSALVARERARLSARSASDADSLVTLARIRRDAGDASELDVQLAALSAGQFANQSALDALESASALLAVQSAMGLSARSVVITLSDSLDVREDDEVSLAPNGTPLLVAAAESEVRASELALSLEHGRRLAPPALSFGFERQEPGGTGNQVLPAVGLTLPFPLFNRNRAGVLAAEAGRDRASAELAQALVDVGGAMARGERERAIAQERLTRTRALIGAAEQVATLALLAYREGASALPSVLEAQRSARETRTQYVEALGALRTATARLRLLALTSSHSTP